MRFLPRSGRSSRTDRVLLALVAAAALGCGAPRALPTVAPISDARPLRLAATRFVAYGDSLVEGMLHGCPGAPATSSIAPDPPAAPGLRSSSASGYSYPARLAALLRERYTGQPIEVVNEGTSGETLEQMATDLGRVLVGDGPDVLLLMVGGDAVARGGADARTAVLVALRRMIRDAKNRGVTVFVATVLPIEQDRCRSTEAPAPDAVILTNVAIRTMVGDEGATLVDLFGSFNGRSTSLIGTDGVHPNAQGYAVIARTFFEVVTRTLEGE